MTTYVNVQEAKTHLSALLARVEAGEDIVLARSGRPVARLAPVEEVASRETGFLTMDVPVSFFDPLPEAELQGWG